MYMYMNEQSIFIQVKQAIHHQNNGHTSDTQRSFDGTTIRKRIIHFLDDDCYERKLHVLG